MAGFATADNEPRLRTASELAARAIRLALGNYRVLISAIAVILVPTFVVGGAALAYWRAKSPTSLNPTGTARVAELVGVAVVVFGNLLAQAAGIHAATNLAAGWPPDWRRSIGAAFSRAATVVTVSLEVAVLSGLGLLLFILPGVYLWFSWLVAMPVVVLEGRTGREALSRSAYLVKGRWWSVLGGYLLAELFIVIPAYLVSFVVGAVVHASLTSQAVTEQLTSVFVELALAPIIVTFVAVTYLDLRLRKEGFSRDNVVRQGGTVTDGDRRGGMRSGAWWDAGPVGGTPPWQAPANSPPRQSGGPSWPPATPGDAPDAGRRPERPRGWPAVSPKPPPPGQAAGLQDDQRAPGGSGEPSDDAPGTTSESL